MINTTSNWTRILCVIGVGFLALTAWSIYRASHDTSAVIDRDYYSHGLRYNQTALEQQAAATLGWTTAVELHGHRLQVSLADQQGAPVTSANASLTLFETRSAKQSIQPLEEVSPGRYQGVIPPHARGETSAEVNFDHQGARLSRRLLINLSDDH